MPIRLAQAQLISIDANLSTCIRNRPCRSGVPHFSKAPTCDNRIDILKSFRSVRKPSKTDLIYVKLAITTVKGRINHGIGRQ